MKIKNRNNNWVLLILGCVCAYTTGLLLAVLIKINTAKNVANEVLLDGLTKDHAMGEYNLTIAILLSVLAFVFVSTVAFIYLYIKNSKK